MPATVEIRRAADRAVTTTSWLTSKHSFSFDAHYDPTNTHHGLLLVNNDDTVAPGAGFGTHAHRDMEIVTWVLSGALRHRDSTGNSGVIYPGLAQRMSAGSGIRHSEKNDSDTEPVHFIQMWLSPDEMGISPSYQQHEIGPQLSSGNLVTIASGRPGHDAALTLHNRNAALHIARLVPGHDVALPAAPSLHLFVSSGSLTLAGSSELHEGDAVRFTDADGHRVSASASAEILVWEMHARLSAVIASAAEPGEAGHRHTPLGRSPDV